MAYAPNMIFEFTYESGRVQTITGDNILEAIARVDMSNVVKVESVDKKLLRLHIQSVNGEFHKFGRDYHTRDEIYGFVCNTLLNYGFEDLTASDFEIEGDEGANRCVPIGKGVFLCVTWYKLQSGRFEFVGYIS